MGFHKEALIFLTLLAWTCAQGPDSRGTEFFVAFLENAPLGTEPPTDMELFIVTASNTPADVTVTMPLYDETFSESVTVSRGAAQKVVIPVGARGVGVEKSNKGIWVQSTQEISVFAVNKESKSTDAYLALPVDVLGTEYRALTYETEAELLVVATEDSTNVSVTWPSGNDVSVTYDGTTYGPGDTLTVTLNKFEVFHALDTRSAADFTGAHILSDKPVAVVSGNQKIKVPVSSTKNSADHLTEMMLPVDTWGKQFVTSSTPDRTGGDVYRFMASEDNTTVTLSGGTSFTLNAGEFQELEIASGDYQTVTADKAILVAMFSRTFDSDGSSGGDPAMTILPPVLQYASDNTWSTIRQPDGQEFDNKISVVIETDQIDGLRLDGQNITWQEQTVVTGTTKTHLWASVDPGSHNLYHIDPTVTFMAAASGTANANSYAYLAGLRMAKINTVCVPSATVAGDIVDNDCDDRIDEETDNGIDDDGDGAVDEDLALPPRVDGQWGSWSSPGPCSVDCGSGFAIRTRSCDSPAPANGGFDCVGDSVDLVPCTGPGPCTPGPVCRNNRQRCLAGLTCNTNSFSCPCPPGQSGNGYIECVESSQYLCFAEGDPHLHGWEGAVAPISLPCWYRLGNIAAPITSPSGLEYDMCSVDVKALNELTADGMYYVKSVSVDVNFIKYGSNGDPQYLLGTAENFSITRKDVNATSGENPWPRAATVSNGVAIIPSWDDSDNFAILEIGQCGIKIKFRPYVPGESIPMTFKPGVTLSVATDSSFLSPANNTACRHPDDGPSSFKIRASSLKLGGSGLQALIHDVLTTTDVVQTVDNADYGSECDAASTQMVTCDLDKRPLALRLCSSIVNSRMTVLSCLTASNVSPMEVFNNCLQWVCNSSTAACNNYLNAITTNSCTTTPLMNETECSLTALNDKIAQYSA